MKMVGVNPEEVPNVVGRDFENETTATLTDDDIKNLNISLDWFPDYFKKWEMYPAPGIDLDPDFTNMPLFPSYNYPKKITHPEREFRIPSKGGRYHLPMLITSRGGCSSIHEGCDYCMGAKVSVNHKIYNSAPIIYNNSDLITHIKQIADKYSQMTLYINSPFI